MEASYSFAILTGLLGGFGHCLGMCGPILASQALRRGAVVPGGAVAPPAGLGPRLFPELQYHLGRLFTYSAIGALMGQSGAFASTAGALAGLQDLAAILAGAVMLAMGLGLLGLWRGLGLLEGRNRGVLSLARRLMNSTSRLRILLLGTAMGLLPCGLSYTVFIAAAGSGSALGGLLIALLFGLGTLPALLLFGALVGSLGAAFRSWMTRLGGVLVVAMGLWYLLRALGLNAGL